MNYIHVQMQTAHYQILVFFFWQVTRQMCAGSVWERNSIFGNGAFLVHCFLA